MSIDFGDTALPMKTNLSPSDLNILLTALVILDELGEDSALPNPTPDDDTPVWVYTIDQAHYYLSVVLMKFAVGRWTATDPWDWPDDVPPPLSVLTRVLAQLKQTGDYL